MRFSTIIAVTFLGVAGSASPFPQSSSSGYFPSIREMAWCLIPWNIDDCIKAQGHADKASQEAARLYPAASLHNGKGDAFRHCYWNARMTIDLGAGKAKTIADNHEDGSNGPDREKRMDRANNASGRSIGRNASGGSKSAKYTDSRNDCKSAADGGRLVVLE